MIFSGVFYDMKIRKNRFTASLYMKRVYMELRLCIHSKKCSNQLDIFF